MNTNLKRLLGILLILIPFVIITWPILHGAIPFWYDPARDLLMAWDNLKKITLIGSTSGIPGIFYGPYWIWLLSLGLAISKDPRLVLFLVLTIPYFIGISAMIFLLNKTLIEKLTVPALWILTIFCFAGYASQIWNPNLAPLLFFIMVTIFYKTKDIGAERNIKSFLLMGLVYGLLFNFHISFGVVLLLTWVLYFIFNLFLVLLSFPRRRESILMQLSNWVINCVSFWSGFLIIFIPFFIFELRHGFMQIKSLIYTLLHPTAVVGVIGISKLQIVQKFIESAGAALSAPPKFSLLLLILIIGGILFNLAKKKYSKDDLRLLLFLIINIVSLFIVYLGTKNPVWNYHFIAVEVIFLFLTILSVKKNIILEKALFGWAIIILISRIIPFGQSFTQPQTQGELMAKKSNVEFVINDSKNSPYIYFAKNPSIYSYDYDYLFRWVGSERKQYSEQNIEKAKNIYVIVPFEVRNDKIGFTLNRTPEEKYRTVSEWVMPDKTIIIKRVLR